MILPPVALAPAYFTLLIKLRSDGSPNLVESATYGGAFVAACLASEQIMDLRYTLSMMGASVEGKAYMFGDNQSVITSSTIPLVFE
jgi:hypothetical protein